MKKLQFMQPLELNDLQLIRAVENGNESDVIKALMNGANPNTQKRHRGLPVGEPVLLRAVRENHDGIVDILLNSGAQISPVIILATAMSIERATRRNKDDDILKSMKIFKLFEQNEVDWTVTDRFVGSGIRAIDLIAGAQPQWAVDAARRLNTSIMDLVQRKTGMDLDLNVTLEEKKVRVRNSN